MGSTMQAQVAEGVERPLADLKKMHSANKAGVRAALGKHVPQAQAAA